MLAVIGSGRLPGHSLHSAAMGDLPVYDVVLLPASEVNARSIHLSQQLADLYGTEFVLRDKGVYPHLSLYMANFTASQRDEAINRLHAISVRTPEFVLEASHFAGNEHGMFELFYDKTDAITRLQEDVVAAMNPLRTGPRQRDPVGRALADLLLTASSVARANLDRYGYDEVGELFRPHITVTRFQHRDQRPGPALLPPAKVFTAAYRTLALCVMGEHGTCTDIVAEFDLATVAVGPSAD
ncbi:DUF1045 domain-containing protein [Nonomuraea sp. bgisy101]|uniref:DUF1045 domain-containing protein n=1 Tax=Nonomuraea sp. bgisy101 TaxID=3413784 RepID=UPI003D73CC46